MQSLQRQQRSPRLRAYSRKGIEGKGEEGRTYIGEGRGQLEEEEREKDGEGSEIQGR